MKFFTMKINILTMLMLATFSQMYAQIDLTQKIPVDEKVNTGVLDNGMTYYVRANAKPENRAELFLVLKAGSIDEDDNQQGIAHFLEHMAFNGTANFPKNDLVKYFESIGMEFGPEINAYTSFDETVYMLKVPLDSAKYVDKGLQVLFDWSSQISNETEAIDKERGVIIEEWRRGLGANDRMSKITFPVIMKDSKYANRLPIGKIDIIQNFDPEVLRKFYADWYRPDLQAVIVVGDFDQKAMVEKVKEKFSKIPKRENPRKKLTYEIPSHKETLVTIATDKEAQVPVAQIIYKHKKQTVSDLKEYRDYIIQSIHDAIVSNRLSEKLQQANPPYLYASSGYSSFIGPLDAYSISVVGHNNGLLAGMKEALLENERVKKYGFTETELERVKESLIASAEKQYNEREHNTSIGYANSYKSNFLANTPIISSEASYELIKQLVPTISLEEVNGMAAKWRTKENIIVVINAPEKEDVIVPTEQEIRELLATVEHTTVDAYNDNVIEAPLISELPNPGKVVSSKNIDGVAATEWKLSNGATVVFKNTDFKSDEIQFGSYSPGGTSRYPLEDDISAAYTTAIMSKSGLGLFDNIALRKKLAGKVAGVGPYLATYSEGFSGYSSVKDLETMLQILYLYFDSPRFDQDIFQSTIERNREVLNNRSSSPESVFSDTVKVVFSNYNPRVQPMTAKRLDEADLGRIAAIGKERFSNASDFKFFFVGNIDTTIFKPLIEKYIGAIPSTGVVEERVALDIEKPTGIVEKTVYKGQEEKGIQLLTFHGKFDYTEENKLRLPAMEKILTTRLLEEIREKRGDVYSIGANVDWTKYPKETYSISISYSTSPKKLEEVKNAIFDVIKDFQTNGPTQEEVAKAKEKLKRMREVALKSNAFWMNTLQAMYQLFDGDFNKMADFNKVVDELSPENMKAMFNSYFDFNNYIGVALEPEK